MNTVKNSKPHSTLPDDHTTMLEAELSAQFVGGHFQTVEILDSLCQLTTLATWVGK